MYRPEEIRQMIIQQGVLDIAIEDVQSLSEEEYALARKDYFVIHLCFVELIFTRTWML